MGIKELCMKALAVIIAVGALSCAFGREMLNFAFAENPARDISISAIDKKSGNSAIAKVEEKVSARAKLAEIARESRGKPFLCNGIKYNCREADGYILYTNANQMLLYSKVSAIWTYYRYDCPAGKARYSCEACLFKVKQAVRECGISAEIKIAEAQTNEKYFYSTVELKGFEGAKIYVNLRRDTGSVVLFDARELEKYLVPVNKER